MLLKPLVIEPAQAEREIRKTIEEQVKKIENLGGAVAQSHLRSGDAADEVVKSAQR